MRSLAFPWSGVSNGVPFTACMNTYIPCGDKNTTSRAVLAGYLHGGFLSLFFLISPIITSNYYVKRGPFNSHFLTALRCVSEKSFLNPTINAKKSFFKSFHTDTILARSNKGPIISGLVAVRWHRARLEFALKNGLRTGPK